MTVIVCNLTENTGRRSLVYTTTTGISAVIEFKEPFCVDSIIIIIKIFMLVLIFFYYLFKKYKKEE